MPIKDKGKTQIWAELLLKCALAVDTFLDETNDFFRKFFI